MTHSCYIHINMSACRFLFIFRPMVFWEFTHYMNFWRSDGLFPSFCTDFFLVYTEHITLSSLISNFVRLRTKVHVKIYMANRKEKAYITSNENIAIFVILSQLTNHYQYHYTSCFISYYYKIGGTLALYSIENENE